MISHKVSLSYVPESFGRPFEAAKVSHAQIAENFQNYFFGQVFQTPRWHFRFFIMIWQSFKGSLISEDIFSFTLDQDFDPMGVTRARKLKKEA